MLQLRLSEEKDIAWPDEEFERIARALYQSQFDLSSTTTTMLEHLCLNLAHSLTRSLLNSGHAAGIGIGRERPHRLLRLQGTPGRPRVLAIDEREHQSVLLPLLRLQHVVQADTALHGPSRWRLGHVASSVPYRNVPPRTNPPLTDSRCSNHHDDRATAPGVEIFDCENRVWLQPERFLEENECLVYFGDALNHMTRGCVPAAIHRVVREPQTERFSMPFEMKPISSAIMAVDAEFPAVTEPSKLMRVGGPGRCFLTEPPEYDAIPFSQLEIRKTWERVERSVARADAHAEAQLHLQQQMKELDESDHNGPDLYESTGTDMDA